MPLSRGARADRVAVVSSERTALTSPIGLSRRVVLAGGLAGLGAMALAPLRAFATAPAPAASVPEGLARLARAYPDHIASVEANALVWTDGTRMTYDPGVRWSDHEERLNKASLWDQMDQPYRPGPLAAPPALNVEPGRLRHEPFFLKMYGATQEAVEAKLVSVAWPVGAPGESLRVTTINGVDKRVAAVAQRLAALPEALRPYLTPPGGGYLWRAIAGTSRLSVHSFGIAIDIGTRESDYWLWEKNKAPDKPIAYRNRIPQPIVDAFEAERFIWGGQWYHYDTMHFEYRPELFATT